MADKLIRLTEDVLEELNKSFPGLSPNKALRTHFFKDNHIITKKELLEIIDPDKALKLINKKELEMEK